MPYPTRLRVFPLPQTLLPGFILFSPSLVPGDAFLLPGAGSGALSTCSREPCTDISCHSARLWTEMQLDLPLPADAPASEDRVGIVAGLQGTQCTCLNAWVKEMMEKTRSLSHESCESRGGTDRCTVTTTPRSQAAAKFINQVPNPHGDGLVTSAWGNKERTGQCLIRDE